MSAPQETRNENAVRTHNAHAVGILHASDGSMKWTAVVRGGPFYLYIVAYPYHSPPPSQTFEKQKTQGSVKVLTKGVSSFLDTNPHKTRGSSSPIVLDATSLRVWSAWSFTLADV